MSSNNLRPTDTSMSDERRVRVYPSLAELAPSVAAQFSSRITALLDAQDDATVVLTGGGVGMAVLAAISDLEVDWSRINLWWGDERWLPRGHAERNDHQATVTLLDRVEIPEHRIHRFPASDEIDDLDQAALRYADELKDNAVAGRDVPQFDILFLGLGPDGHIASLFPGHPQVEVTDRTVVAVRNSPKPPPERLSLTLPAINSARAIWVAVTGADKAAAVSSALTGADRHEVPATAVHGTEETIFFIDQAAAGNLPADLLAHE